MIVVALSVSVLVELSTHPWLPMLQAPLILCAMLRAPAAQPSRCSYLAPLVVQARRCSAIRGSNASPQPPPVSVPLLIGDSAAIAAYSLQLSSFKALTLAYSDLSSPGFDLATDMASFDLQAVLTYVIVEQIGAASLVAGWIIGGAFCSRACSEDWAERDQRGRASSLLRGWLVAAPLLVAFKYGVLSQLTLPTLGRSAQALQLEAQLSGLTFGNVCGDTLGLVGVLFLWRQLLLRYPNLLP